MELTDEDFYYLISQMPDFDNGSFGPTKTELDQSLPTDHRAECYPNYWCASDRNILYVALKHVRKIADPERFEKALIPLLNRIESSNSFYVRSPKYRQEVRSEFMRAFYHAWVTYSASS